MVTTPNYDLDIDTTLGGNNASDYVIPSQKAIKSYVDNNSGGGGTVDQTYNSTSANAQSGVAIAGAGFLTSSDLLDYVTTNTAQTITAKKTFNVNGTAIEISGGSLVTPDIYFNSVGDAHLKYIYDTSTTPANLDFNISNTISTGDSKISLSIATTSNSLGNQGKYRIETPTLTNAKTPFNLSNTETTFYFPLGFTNGTSTVLTANTGKVDISSLLPTVDQTYDGTSANAQSGVAIAGAKFLQNEATHSGSSIIVQGATKNSLYAIGLGLNNSVAENGVGIGLAATTTNSNSTSIGANSRARGQQATALGSGAMADANSTLAVGSSAGASVSGAIAVGMSSLASGTRATALGSGATAGGNYAIQIGYGTNNTANTLNVGFWNSTNTHYNWQLLDGTTGLIPDARISTNIARTSSVADNTLSNVSSIDSNSAVATALDGKADTNLSNLSATGKTVLDGQWVSHLQTVVAEGTSLRGSTNLTATVNVPNDGHTYEVLFRGNVTTGSSSSNYVRLWIWTNKASTMFMCGARTRSNSTMFSTGSCITYMTYATNNLTIVRSNDYNGTAQLETVAYRRVGTNT